MMGKRAFLSNHDGMRPGGRGIFSGGLINQTLDIEKTGDKWRDKGENVGKMHKNREIY
ncbi:hypothetical protein [Enterocloster citroniae]